MAEAYQLGRFVELPLSKGFSYWISDDGGAVVETDYGITLNSLVPSGVHIEHNPELLLTESFFEPEKVVNINLDLVFEKKGPGKIILAHELGHVISHEPILSEARDTVADGVKHANLPWSQRVSAMNWVARTDMFQELAAWEASESIAKFVDVGQSEFDFLRSLALQTYRCKVVDYIASIVNTHIDSDSDRAFSVFDPYILAVRDMTSDELQLWLQEAYTLHASAMGQLRDLLDETVVKDSHL